VKFVCMGGSALRAERLAVQISEALQIPIPEGGLVPLGKIERYSLFKVGPVISVNHGMGMPSLSILLHEITKLLYHARATDVTFIRVGTSGGIGLEPGTVVITEEGVNAKLKHEFKQTILGITVRHSTKFDQELVDLAYSLANQAPAIPCTRGLTMGTDDFYEGQSRVDGAIVEYSDEDRENWLKKLHKAGVTNIEMESCCLAAWCNRLKIPGLIICCTLLDRLHGDQVTSSPEQLATFVDNALQVTLRVIKHKLQPQ